MSSVCCARFVIGYLITKALPRPRRPKPGCALGALESSPDEWSALQPAFHTHPGRGKRVEQVSRENQRLLQFC